MIKLGPRMFARDIEQTVRRMIDHADRLLLDGRMSQVDHDEVIREIEIWAAAKLTDRLN